MSTKIVRPNGETLSKNSKKKGCGCLLLVLLVLLCAGAFFSGNDEQDDSPKIDNPKTDRDTAATKDIPKPPNENKTNVHQVKYGLSEEKRIEIFQQVIRAEEEAEKYALSLYPTSVNRLKPGHVLKVTCETPIAPKTSGGIDDLESIQRIPVGMSFKIIRKAKNSYYLVDVIDQTNKNIGRGYVYSSALTGLLKPDIDKINKAEEGRYKDLKQKILDQTKLSEKELKDIEIEGLSKDWPIR